VAVRRSWERAGREWDEEQVDLHTPPDKADEAKIGRELLTPSKKLPEMPKLPKIEN
jgi:hypothetical protein